MINSYKLMRYEVVNGEAVDVSPPDDDHAWRIIDSNLTARVLTVFWHATTDSLERRCRAWLPESKIKAIKLYREETGVGLKEAKDYVDGLM